MKRLLTLAAILLLIAGCTEMGKQGRQAYSWGDKEKAYRIHAPEEKSEQARATGRGDELLYLTRSLIGSTEFHYTGKYCSYCHERTPKRGGEKFLKFGGDYNLLCGKCHLQVPNYIHPTDVVPSDKKKTRVPVDLPLEKGKITCLTCHDLYWQCQERTSHKNSLRGAPYPKAVEFCLKCHDEKSYVPLNPHKQFDQKGNLMAEKCLYCHEKRPQEKETGVEDAGLVGELGLVCERCHFRILMRSRFFSHMLKPTPEILETMKETEEKHNLLLPLDSEGKITCATCHNPHDRGVISADRPGAKGAGRPYGLRLPDPVCIACHGMAQIGGRQQ